MLTRQNSQGHFLIIAVIWFEDSSLLSIEDYKQQKKGTFFGLGLMTFEQLLWAACLGDGG